MRRTITLAHQGEAFARQPKLMPLDHYLKPLTKKRRRGDGSAELAAFLDRKIAKQDRAAPAEK